VLLGALVSVLAITSCGSKVHSTLKKSQPSYTLPVARDLHEKTIAFWKWFQDREAKCGFTPSRDDELLAEIKAHLLAIDDGLRFKIGKSDSTFERRIPNMRPGLNELSITSNRCRRRTCAAAVYLTKNARCGDFEPVLYNGGQAVLVSPTLLVTLGDHPPCTELGGELYNSSAIDWDSIFFSVSENAERFDVTLFTEINPKTNLNTPHCVIGLSPIIDRVVETMFGEYIVENLLGEVKVKPLSDLNSYPSTKFPIRRASEIIMKQLSDSQRAKVNRIVNDADVSCQSTNFKIRTALSWFGCRNKN